MFSLVKKKQAGTIPVTTGTQSYNHTVDGVMAADG